MSYLTTFWTSSDASPGCVRSSDKEFRECGYLEAGGWTVPLLWSLCFAGSDVNVLQLPEEEWHEPDQPVFGASCDAPMAKAIERLERRIPSLKRILAPVHHGTCDLFLARLEESQESFTHADLSLLLENEDDPSDGRWKGYWSGLIDGLDTPVSNVRTGIAARFLGLGLPTDWKYVGFWALSNHGPLRRLQSPDLEFFRLTGAQDVREICLWQV